MAIAINIVKPKPSHDGQSLPKIFNFETVASYNWIDEPSPTILVPDESRTDSQQHDLLTVSHYERHSPNLGSTSDRPLLRPDSGGHYVDQKAKLTPGSPLQELIRAVHTCQPEFDFTHVSIVTDRKPVRCLLGFVRAEPVAFEFGVAVIGSTALFTRMESMEEEDSESL